MPATTESIPLDEDPRSSRWDLALVLVLGGVLLVFGWLDGASFLASRHKLPFTFTMNSRPGGVRVGLTQEIFRHLTDDSVCLTNFAALEHQGSLNYRQSLGPVSTLEITANHAHARLNFQFHNVIADQDLAVACNGRVLEEMNHLPLDAMLSRLYSLDLRPGANVVTFTYRRYNHDGSELAPDDPRPIAGTFNALDLLLE